MDRLAAGTFEPPCPSCAGDLVSVAVGEEAPVDPRNVYAATKVHQEHLCAVYGRASGSPVISLRYHNVFGPRSPIDTPYSGVASLFVSALRNGEPPRGLRGRGTTEGLRPRARRGSGQPRRARGPAECDGPFNIASGHPHTIAELAHALAHALGPSGPGPTVTGEWRLGDVRHIVASPDKAARELGFVARVPFEEGIAELAGLSSSAD